MFISKLYQLIKSLRSSEGLAASALVVSGTLVGTGISAVALFIISRYLGPSLFGEFSVGVAISLMLTKVNDLGLSSVIVKFCSNEEGKSDAIIKRNIIGIKYIVSLCIFGLGLLTIPLQQHYLRLEHPMILVLTYTFGLATVYYEHLQALLQSAHHYVALTAINIAQALIKLLGVVVLVLLSSLTQTTSFFLYASAPLLPVLFSPFVLGMKFMQSWIPKFSLAGFSPTIQTFSAHSATAIIIGGIIENIDILVVQSAFTSFDSGLLAGANRIATLFSMVAYSLALVLNPRAARYKKKHDIRQFLYKGAGVSALAILGFIAFIPFAGLAIDVTIGPEYRAGLPALLLLSASSFLTIALIPFMAVFYAFDEPKYFSFAALAQLIVVLAGTALFVPTGGALAAASVRLISRGFLAILTIVWALVLYRKHYAEQR